MPYRCAQAYLSCDRPCTIALAAAAVSVAAAALAEPAAAVALAAPMEGLKRNFRQLSVTNSLKYVETS